MTRPVALYYDVLDFQTGSLECLGSYFEVFRLPDPSHDVKEMLHKASVLIAPMGFVFDKSKLDCCPHLLAIGSPTTGVPHIDVEYAKARGITICSLRDQQAFLATITPTSELAWGLILAVTRRLPWAYEAVCASQWNGRHFGAHTPHMLSAMSLGVIGLGRLGSLMARYAEAFRMQVFYYDPYRQDERYTRCDTLLDLARASDIVTVHVHATPETENLIDRTFIEAMRPGSYLINTARGNILDERALLVALTTGHLAGAGLDTLRGEHLPNFTERLHDHPLIQYANTHDNLVLTPHYGGATRDAWEKTERRIIELIIDDLKHRGVL